MDYSGITSIIQKCLHTTMKQRKVSAPELKRNNSFSDNDDTTADESVAKEEKPKEPVTLTKVLTRTITACLLTGLYLALLQAGHFYCILAVVISQVCWQTHFDDFEYNIVSD